MDPGEYSGMSLSLLREERGRSGVMERGRSRLCVGGPGIQRDDCWQVLRFQTSPLPTLPSPYCLSPT
jgi:hypothetical protein